MKKFFIPLTLVFFSISAIAQKQGNGYDLDKEYPVAANGILTLKCSDAKVSVSGTTRSNVHLKIHRLVTAKGWLFGEHDEFSVDVNQTRGNLEIEEHKHHQVSGVIGYYSEKYTIDISVPEGMSLTIKGDDGDYQIKNVDGAISIDVDDADIDLAGCSGDSFNFKLDDGDLSMDTGKGKLEIDADDGDIKIANAQFSSINADMDDGDLSIETGIVDNGRYYIQAQDGLVALTITNGGGQFEIQHDDSRITTEGNFEKIEESDERTRIALAKGNANVQIRADDARVRLANR
jgi:DUF4097 and DUF4098 domain-containing protein YvlB